MAARLHMSVWETKNQTSSSELVKWAEFFKRERERPTRDQYYLAQIAYYVYELRFLVVKREGTPLTVEEFLLKFESVVKNKVEEVEETDKKFEREWQTSKGYLLAALGVTDEEVGDGFNIDLRKRSAPQLEAPRPFPGGKPEDFLKVPVQQPRNRSVRATKHKPGG